MKLKIYTPLLFLLLLLGGSKTNAQVASVYSFTLSNAAYSPLSSPSVIATATGTTIGTSTALDVGNFPVPLPFTFFYNGTSYTNCNISANGYITFGAVVPPTNDDLPLNSTTGFDGAISALGANLWGLYTSKANSTTGSPTLTGVTSFYGIKAGTLISSPNIAPGTTIISFDTAAHTISLSANATVTASNDIVTWPTGEISVATIGVTPNRLFTIQYKNMGINNTTPGFGGGLNFQIILEEGGAAAQQKIRMVYGPSSYLLSTPTNVQVGLRGNTNTDFNNRQSTTAWNNTAAGTLNTHSVQLSSTLIPTSRMFTWSPPARPIASFNVIYQSPNRSQPIQCTDQSQNLPTSWKWILRNTSSATPVHPNVFYPSDTVQNPVLTVGQLGTFDLCMIVRNTLGTDTLCKLNHIQPVSTYNVCAGQSIKQDTIAEEPEGSLELFTVGGTYLPTLIGTCNKGFQVSTCADTVEVNIMLFDMRTNVLGSQADSMLVHIGSKTGPVIARFGGNVLPPAFASLKVAGGKFFVETKLASSIGLSGAPGYKIYWRALPSASILGTGHTSATSSSVATVTNSTQKVTLYAHSSLFKAKEVFFSEIVHERSASGQPIGGWPGYLIADDYIELTGYPFADIGGFTLEEWSGSTLQHSITFAGGVLFNQYGTMVLATGQLGASTPDHSNFYYHTGNTISHSATSDNRGYILKNASGVIVDVAVYGTYTFPVAAGVTTAHWSGSTPALSGSGNRLNTPDNNTASSWINSSSSPQNPNLLNAGVSYPIMTSAAGFSWLYEGMPISGSPVLTVGPFSTPGTYQYVASYGCGTLTSNVSISASSTVPVKLVHFDALKQGNDVLLSWKTASEVNSNHFSIERSMDGKNYKEIEMVKAAGNSTKTIYYKVKDENIRETINSIKPSTKNNQVYYRLKMIDNDGSFEHSTIAVVSVNNLEGKQMSVVPNPFTDKADLHISAISDGTANIEVIDITGKTIISYTKEVKQGNTVLPLQRQEELKPGIYFITIEVNGTKQTSKLMKQ